jgi:hypothetical protein
MRQITWQQMRQQREPMRQQLEQKRLQLELRLELQQVLVQEQLLLFCRKRTKQLQR